MTTMRSTRSLPALAGGDVAFPEGLALTRPTLPDLPCLTDRLNRILESGQLTNGQTVRELEETVAERLGVGHVVAVASCTSGLMLTLQALGVKGPVVMPSFTFSASAHAVMWAGGRPRFADISADSLCVDPDSVRRLVAGTAAITATHIYGTPCRTGALEDIAAAAKVPLVFDAAHALGSKRNGKPVGGFGTAEVFSLSPTKVTVAGEGGLVATDDESLARTVRLGRNYGNPGDYDCQFPGLNARMSELHAAVALHSLKWLDHQVSHRNELVAEFWRELAGVPGLRRPLVDPGDLSTYKDLTLVVEPGGFGLSARGLAVALEREGVDTRRYYHPSIHAQRAYRDAERTSLPVTERIAPAVLSVPLWSQMSVPQLTRLTAAIVRIHEHFVESGRSTLRTPSAPRPRASREVAG
jgi:dTDP-4-amino-4,6-dideoxygalactose transaminase